MRTRLAGAAPARRRRRRRRRSHTGPGAVDLALRAGRLQAPARLRGAGGGGSEVASRILPAGGGRALPAPAAAGRVPAASSGFPASDRLRSLPALASSDASRAPEEAHSPQALTSSTVSRAQAESARRASRPEDLRRGSAAGCCPPPRQRAHACGGGGGSGCCAPERIAAEKKLRQRGGP